MRRDAQARHHSKGARRQGRSALAAVQARARAGIAGALAGVLVTAVALQAGLVVVRAPRTDVVALTAGPWGWALFPPQRMEIRWTRFSVEEGGQRRHKRHGCAAPLRMGAVQNRIGDAQLTSACLQ